MATKKKQKKLSFADAARTAMSAHNPKYEFLETTGGSGPLVSFERAVIKAKQGRLREVVMLQKGLHGADWFRVNLYPIFEGPAASGKMDHTLWAGQTAGKDVHWESDSELESALDAACSSLEPHAKKFFKRFEDQLGKLAPLLGNLVALYTQWLRAEGESLPPSAFNKDDDRKLLAYESFHQWLVNKKLLQGIKGDIDTCLWRFWHKGRPMREIDYDPKDYYDCTKCTAFVRRVRARLEKHKIAGFGVHHALVCAKH